MWSNASPVIWSQIGPALADLDAAAGHLETMAEGSGDRTPNELTQARRAIRDAEDLSRCDPLGLGEDAVASIERMVDRARVALAEAAGARQELEADLVGARVSADRCLEEVARVRELCADVAARIAGSDAWCSELDRIGAQAVEVHDQVGRVGRETGTTPVTLRRRIADLATEAEGLRAEAHDVGQRASAALAARDELRGRLEAYRAKAVAIGRAEDVALDGLYGKVRDALYQAPCDVDAGRAPGGRVPTGHPHRRRGGGLMEPCVRPGCTGQFEDGYCNVCGFAASSSRPVAPPSPPPDVAGPGHSPVDAGVPTAGCDGTIEDGYCTVCGLAARGPAAAPVELADPGSSVTQETGRVHRPGPDSSGSTSGATSRGSSGSRGNLGSGLVEIPVAPARDPLDAVLADPQVPERKRFCATCGEAVGRSRQGRPDRTEGWCPHCGSPYSFTPKLAPGDQVAGQYDVVGCLAHGGLGWVYLARDRNVHDRWVVLKGLLDSQDRSAMAAAIAERRFLAEVEHPTIVRIYNFVQHGDAGYIVMEYVGGESLREVRNRYRERFGGPMPVAQAVAYILEILPAFGYLHRRGLVYCDFKPDNVIQTEEQLKLIDLGGVRSVDDEESDLYGTVGYQAPEVPRLGASVSSDLYTVARTLAVLSFDFVGFQDERRYATSLPPVQDVPAFGRYESFHLFMLKATAEDPRARFQSAGEMADQLVGVLREVVAVDGGKPPPAASTLFSGEFGVEPELCSWQNLPLPVVDPFDPAAPLLATAVLAGADQARAILEAAPRSPELSFHLARLAIDEDSLDEAAAALDSAEARKGGWRAAWWRGVLALAADAPLDAQPLFAAVAAELPGERAPKLALAVAHEQAAEAVGDDADRRWHLAEAARYYGLVAATDATYASAMFGLARVRSALGDRSGAAEALTLVPGSSSAHTASQLALIRLWCDDIGDQPPEVGDLVSASALIDRIRVEPSARLPLVRQLQEQALHLLTDGRVVPDDSVLLAGASLEETPMREALELTLRRLAKLAPNDRERCDLVDLANANRPRTLT